MCSAHGLWTTHGVTAVCLFERVDRVGERGRSLQFFANPCLQHPMSDEDAEPRIIRGLCESEKFGLDRKASSHKATVNVAELRAGLTKYLNDFTQEQAKDGNRSPFVNPDRPLALRKLKVVAFVQDDLSKKILQAVQADVPEEK